MYDLMPKIILQTSRVGFRISNEIKQKCEIALSKESKGLSEYLRDCMVKKVKDFEKLNGNIDL